MINNYTNIDRVQEITTALKTEFNEIDGIGDSPYVWDYYSLFFQLNLYMINPGCKKIQVDIDYLKEKKENLKVNDEEKRRKIISYLDELIEMLESLITIKKLINE